MLAELLKQQSLRRQILIFGLVSLAKVGNITAQAKEAGATERVVL